MSTGNVMDRQRLLETIIQQFNTNELKLLCFDIGADYEDLGGDSKAIKCLELLLFAERRSKLANLLSACEKARSDVDWAGVVGLPGGGQQVITSVASSPKVANASSQTHSSADSSVSDSSVKGEEVLSRPRTGVFVSYSHHDKKWLEKLQTLLKPLLRKGALYLWADNNIETGMKWRSAIQTSLDTAKVGVMLVSPDFLASDFICGQELPPLLKAAEQGGLKVCWVLIRSCLYETSPLADFQAAHDISRPLNSLSEPELDKALVQICNEIVRLSNAA